MRRLPFLNGIRAFEAAGRLGGFAAAAAELHVSPAAVSRLVKLLESRLGLALFERRANRLALTPAGARYLAGLTGLLDGLERLTEEVAALGGRQVLTLGVGPTFAIRWLIPRLADWQRRHPGIELRIATGGAQVPFAPDWSAGIRLGEGRFPGLVSIPLLAADLTPVCAPALARRLAAPGDLAGESLLRVAHAPEDWPRWLAAAGCPGIAAQGPVFGQYGQALQAAADGLGVAMGIRPYIDDDLAAGRLLAPFALAVSKGMRWSLVHAPQRAAEPALAAFIGWITAAAGEGKEQGG
ncbi:LysR substrate-binding domain-containing protein [Paracraurococcus ruber]|uniref:LysR family transcriptional regulator n=1 Tax=Paracraurococcus ruber TaxID=77675 RepID=A0ABS1D2H3_9PROT|nr:LysR substrate-binding domain-containing protein [Paracraurococcus ruber]MBK1660640.1 LysR family transcriptional regulator [Paracraurococcus ruber]TDG27264.1 LysR family transcriptional regulator [Paracraurococcus ruber]